MGDSLKVNICRACLTQEGDFQSVFVSDENSGLTIQLSEMIMAYTSVQITLGDGLPEQICASCAKKVVHMYLFKQQCEESDATLRQQLYKPPIKVCTITNEQRLAAEALNLDPYLLDVVIKPECNETEGEETVNLEGFDVTFGSNENESDVEVASDSKEKLQCGICFDIITKDSLNTHLKSHQAPREVKSEVHVQFDNVMTDVIISDNFEQKFDPTELKCMPCNKDFSSKADFISHITTHEIEIKRESLKCQICSKHFSKPSLLARHIKIHDTIKEHVCKLCNKEFTRSEQLVNHMNAHSGVKPHVCNICSKGFNQVSNLRDHMRTHNGEKPFLCSTCGKGFNQLGNLRQHIIRHSGIKAHLCSTCGNGFASKGELCAHVRKHTGARPFVCPVCNHGFTTSSSLTKHKRIHSGEKPYECDVCKMKFSRSGILARHRRTHTGEKPYVCKHCSKAFSQSNDLSSHLRIHTGEKPYICDTCGQPFRQSSALKSHKKTHMDRTSIFDIERPRTIIPIVRNNIANAVP